MATRLLTKADYSPLVSHSRLARRGGKLFMSKILGSRTSVEGGSDRNALASWNVML